MASWKKVLVSGSSIDVAGITLGGTAITSNASELNLLDGVSGLVKADFTKLAAIDASAAELNLLDGVTGLVQGDFTKLAAIDASAAELNQLDDVSVGGTSTGDIVTIDGTQTLTNKTINASQLSGTVANARLDQQLQDVAGLAVTNGGVIVGDGSNFVLETGATLRTSLGLGTADNVEHAQITGSNALFSGTVSANAFSGDGSGLTGVTGDFPTVHKTGVSLDATKFSVNDGSGKFVSGSQVLNYVSASVYSGVSGDVQINSEGVASIQANSVALGTDTTGNYVQSVANATNGGVTISNGATEGGDATVTLNIDNLSAAAVDVGADSVAIHSSGNGTRKESIVDLVAGIAGTGIAAASGQLSVSYGTTAGTALQGNTTVDDVSVSNLKDALNSNLGTATIGDSNDTIVIAGNLTVQGTKTELQTANLNVEDQFILLDSGSGGGTDTGIIFGGSSDTTNSGYAIGWDDSAGVFGISAEIASDATSLGTLSGKLGYIETSTSNPSSAPTRQGVGSIHVKTDDETIWIYS